ncbi:MAG: hypothetical protein IJ390_10245 [Lachnospiraceae bacterium]|nr:hypothetical protein [Lachnospiraceae bacterium]
MSEIRQMTWKRVTGMQAKMKESIDDAQLVLVGIGTEFAQHFDKMESDGFYIPLLEQIEKEENAELLKQYLHFHYCRRHPDERILRAYEKLAELLEGKNYFIVSLCTDDLIYQSKLDPERIVTPCGGFRAMQCGKECVTDQELLVTDEKVMNALLESIDNCNADLNAIDFPVCAECTKPLWFNQIGSPDYKEEGYLPQWQLYTKWLQGTVNRKLCILELGVGMQFPQIIRFPFEKVGYFNNKANFFRVHSRLYQLTEELKDKGTAIAKNPVDFLDEEA